MDRRTKETSSRRLFKIRCLNLRTGSERLEILDILNSVALPDPFTKSIEVKFDMKSNIKLQGKQSCLKKEVKYAVEVK